MAFTNAAGARETYDLVVATAPRDHKLFGTATAAELLLEGAFMGEKRMDRNVGTTFGVFQEFVGGPARMGELHVRQAGSDENPRPFLLGDAMQGASDLSITRSTDALHGLVSSYGQAAYFGSSRTAQTGAVSDFVVSF